MMPIRRETLANHSPPVRISCLYIIMRLFYTSILFVYLFGFYTSIDEYNSVIMINDTQLEFVNFSCSASLYNAFIVCIDGRRIYLSVTIIELIIVLPHSIYIICVMIQYIVHLASLSYLPSTWFSISEIVFPSIDVSTRFLYYSFRATLPVAL